MPAGDAFSPGQSAEIERALAAAGSRCGLPFSVYVGPLGEGADSVAALWWHGAVAQLWSGVKADWRGVLPAFFLP